jgi:KipI family sensor histidine kinase inhibitor
LIEKLARLDTASYDGAGKGRRWVIPVCYDPSLAEDMAEVADSLHLSHEHIVSLHGGAHYRVYMYGFAPGFTFLGGLPEELTISRRATPRPPAPPGSLLIAGGQALITTNAMPTGWYVIGQTPARMFDPARDRPFMVDPGDEIRFEPIDLATYTQLKREAANGAAILRQETD